MQKKIDNGNDSRARSNREIIFLEIEIRKEEMVWYGNKMIFFVWDVQSQGKTKWRNC